MRPDDQLRRPQEVVGNLTPNGSLELSAKQRDCLAREFRSPMPTASEQREELSLLQNACWK